MSERVFNFGGLRKKYVKRKKNVGVQNKPPPHNAIMKNANALKILLCFAKRCQGVECWTHVFVLSTFQTLRTKIQSITRALECGVP